MARVTTVIITAVDKGDADADFWPLIQWLRDTCIPDVRPLYNVFYEHFNTEEWCKAATLLQHKDGRKTTYELVILHNHLIKRFTSCMARRAPTAEQFLTMIGVN